MRAFAKKACDGKLFGPDTIESVSADGHALPDYATIRASEVLSKDSIVSLEIAFVPPALSPEVLCRCLFDDPERVPSPLPVDSPLPSPPPLVSVVSPTTGERHWTHASLYRCFAHQTYPSKELVVLDTGPRPSPFFTACDDSRVRYTHLTLRPGMPAEEAVVTLETLAQPASDSPPGVKQSKRAEKA